MKDVDIHIDEDNFHTGKGYVGISMSVNAANAYEEGHMPLSKWKKGMLIDKIEENRSLVECDYELLKGQPLEVLKKLLLSSDGEYHHMGIRYVEIEFYYFDTGRLSKLTDADILSEREKNDKKKEQKEIKKKQDAIKNAEYDGRWEVSYIKRSADGRHKREFVLTGTIKDGWFFIDSDSELKGKNKLSIKGKDFKFLRRID